MLSHIFRTLPQNTGTFWTRYIFRTLSWDIVAFSQCCVTLAFWEPWQIQKFVFFRCLTYWHFHNVRNTRILRTLANSEICLFRSLTYLGPEAYSESCLFRHIRVFHFHFNLTYFSTTFTNFDYNDVNFNFWLRLLK